MLPLLLLATLPFLWASQPQGVQAGYEKHEYRIAMRDGKKLFTAVYAPRDRSRSYPIMLHRTPYGVGPYGATNYPSEVGPSDEFSDSGFIFVYQDVRGRMMSEGEFVNMTPHKAVKRGAGDIDESTDTYDTIDWLIRNIPHNNGKVGMWGISYPGFYAAAGMIDAHPALKAVSPQAPIADWFVGDDFHHNGAFYLAHSFAFLASFGRPRPGPTTVMGDPFDFSTPDGYDFYLRMGPLGNANRLYFKNEIPFWNELMRHGNYDDFWKARNLRPHLREIRPAVMTVGGWFDAEDLFGSLAVYRSIEASSPGAYNVLVMGPWYHGGWSRPGGAFLGDVRFGSETADFYRREIELPFFESFLKGNGAPKLPEAYVFATGSNEWRKESVWPPAKARPRKLHLSRRGKLSWTAERSDDPELFDEYVSDPEKPVPYTSEIDTGMIREYMVEDQRFASRRPDVLTYESDVLDRDITVSGPVLSHLSVSTSGTDADFVVKLIDVYPDSMPDQDGARMGGYQQLVRGEAFRGKYRNSFSDPEPFVPGRIATVAFTMPDVFHTFKKGRRIMVQVQSSWFPLVDRNPQQFVDIYSAKASDFRRATQRIYRSKSAPSFMTLNILD